MLFLIPRQMTSSGSTPNLHPPWGQLGEHANRSKTLSPSGEGSGQIAAKRLGVRRFLRRFECADSSAPTWSGSQCPNLPPKP